jgi:predicted nucleic acid-binding protein
LRTFIVDASVATRFLLVEDLRKEALRVLRDFVEGEIDLTAPPVIDFEVGNALRTAVARNLVELDGVIDVYGYFLGFKLGRHGLDEGELVKALEWSTGRGVSFYDGVYIWASKVTGFPLLTADDEQFEAAVTEVRVTHLRDY